PAERPGLSGTPGERGRGEQPLTCARVLSPERPRREVPGRHRTEPEAPPPGRRARALRAPCPERAVNAPTAGDECDAPHANRPPHSGCGVSADPLGTRYIRAFKPTKATSGFEPLDPSARSPGLALPVPAGRTPGRPPAA